MIPRSTFNTLLIGAICLVVGIILGVVGSQRINGDNEAYIRRIVGLAMENSGDNPNRRYVVSDTGQPSIGRADAPVTIVAFEDFLCRYCKQFNDTTLARILETYGEQVRIVHRDFPLLAPQSLDGANAAACADDQGAFWEFHERFYGDQESLTREDFIAYAGELSLNVETFTACYDAANHEEAIYADYLEGQSLGVSGTPTFFINGRILVGARPYELFAAVIEQELAAIEAGGTGAAS